MNIKNFIYFHVFPLINRVLRPISLKIATTRTPNRNFEEFFLHLKKNNYQIKTVIDVGVGQGTHSLYRGTTGAEYILVEPVPDSKKVVAKIADQLKAKFFNVAAGDVDGMIEFNFHDDVTGSSIYRQTESDERLNGKLISVPMRRLDTLLADGVKSPCLLKIDTQGAEINVLKGATNILPMIDMIICEVSFHQFRHGTPEAGEVVAEMAKCGYVLYEILEGHYRPLDNALAQVDMVFVRETSPLRSQKSFFTEAQVDSYIKTGATH